MQNIETEPKTPPVPHKPEITPEPAQPAIPAQPEIKPDADPAPATRPAEVPVRRENKI